MAEAERTEEEDARLTAEALVEREAVAEAEREETEAADLDVEALEALETVAVDAARLVAALVAAELATVAERVDLVAVVEPPEDLVVVLVVEVIPEARALDAFAVRTLFVVVPPVMELLPLGP